MNPSALVAFLDIQFDKFDQSLASPKEVILAALNWPTEGWIVPALVWIEGGASIDKDIVLALE